jgi:hypothetical protein
MTKEQLAEKRNVDRYFKERKKLLKTAKKLMNRKLERKEENYCSFLARGL